MPRCEDCGAIVCGRCGHEIGTGGSCNNAPVHAKGRFFEPKRYEGARCHDCGIEQGGYHHEGCDMEPCPVCGEQFLGCDCAEVVA